MSYDSCNMRRAIPTITFQPTSANLKKLKPARKKLARGELTKNINEAIAFFFANKTEAA